MPPADLSGLNDVVLPGLVPYTPQTAGWALVALGLAAAFLALVFRVRRHRLANAYRRAAASELEALLPALTARQATAFGDLAALLKRVALRVRPREQVAGLVGDAWLEFLDSTWDEEGFVRQRRVLLEAPYLPPERLSTIAASDLDETVSTVRRWLERHRA